MNFTERAFLPFVLTVFAVWLLFRRHERGRLWTLLVSSLVAYGYHEWRLLILLLAYCVVNWAIARWIVRSSHPQRVLALGVTLNLAGLALWKYLPLAVQTVVDLALALKLPWTTTAPSW